MRILFNLISTSLGNNGGSLTLIKSANTLQELGHDVKIIDSGRNQNTWESLKIPHIIIKNSNEIPDADIIIATGSKSVESTNNSKIKLKVHWIRAHETWQYPEDKLVKLLRESPTIKIVNSLCLQDKLKQFGIDSFIIRPGYEFEDYYPKNLRSRKMILGGIYNKGSKRKTKRVEWVFECFSTLKKKYKDIELWMYGNEGVPNNSLVSYYKKDANEVEKNYIYNNIHIWLAPSELEGLHMPPAEAMLTECPVVTTNTEMSGTQDYIIHNQTGVVAENKIESFIEEVSKLLLDQERRETFGREGRKKILELGDRKSNMNKLLDFIKPLWRLSDEK